MSIKEFVENLRAWWDYVCHGQFELLDEEVEEIPGTLRPIKREKADKDAPNWYPNKKFRKTVNGLDAAWVKRPNRRIFKLIFRS